MFGTAGAQAEAMQNGWYWAGAATATALTAYYTAPIALGHLGRVAQVGFIGAGLAGAGYSAYQIGSNWDRMSTTQRIGTVGVIAAGLLGGWAGYARFAPRPVPTAPPLQANPYAGIYEVGPNGGMIGPPLSPNGIGYSSGIAGSLGRPLMFSGMVGVTAAEAGAYAAAASRVAPNSVLNSESIAALRAAGLNDAAIARHLEVLGDIHVFRGTTEGFAGNPVLQRLGLTPTSVDPVVATAFAAEAASKGVNPMILFGPRSAFGETLGMGNVRSLLEMEVSIGLTPSQFAATAPHSISLARSRAILSEMGINVPSSMSNADAFLRQSPRMTPEQIKVFIERASK